MVAILGKEVKQPLAYIFLHCYGEKNWFELVTLFHEVNEKDDREVHVG